MKIFKFTKGLKKNITVVKQTQTGGITTETYDSIIDMPEAERLAYIMAAFSRVRNDPTPEETLAAHQHYQNLIHARLAEQKAHAM